MKATNRKLVALLLCATLAFAGIGVWNSALILGDHFHVSHVWFDMLSAVFFLGAILCSAISVKEGRE